MSYNIAIYCFFGNWVPCALIGKPLSGVGVFSECLSNQFTTIRSNSIDSILVEVKIKPCKIYIRMYIGRYI
jgi:hypothetical protein